MPGTRQTVSGTVISVLPPAFFCPAPAPEWISVFRVPAPASEASQETLVPTLAPAPTHQAPAPTEPAPQKPWGERGLDHHVPSPLRFKATANSHVAGSTCFLYLIFFIFLIERIPSGYFFCSILQHLWSGQQKHSFRSGRGARAELLQRECDAAAMSLSLSSPVCRPPIVPRLP